MATVRSLAKSIFNRLDIRSHHQPAANLFLYSSRHCQTRLMTSQTTAPPAANHGQFLKGPGLLQIFEGNPKRLKRIMFLRELFTINGCELRIAGGAVRDILSGKEPVDIDFATTAMPEKTLEIVANHQDLLRIITTDAGKRHGTISVKFKQADIDFKRIKLSHGNSHSQGEQITQHHKEPEYDQESPFEITTLRCDKLTDGRHAEVEFIIDWRKDAERRDLTINAMFLTLDEGKIVDYFNGQSDLKDGIIRFVGDGQQRIQEDYLRILRFMRFWSRYSRGKQVDEKTLSDLRDNLDGLMNISGERIWVEIRKIFGHLPCHGVLELMLNLRLLDYIGLLDENLEDYDVYSKQVLEKVQLVQDNIQTYCRDFLEPKLEKDPEHPGNDFRQLIPVIIFASLVRTESLCLNAYTRLKFSNLHRDIMIYMVQNRSSTPSLKALKYQLAVASRGERFRLMQIMRAYLVSEGLFESLEELQSWEVPQFPCDGKIVSNELQNRNLARKNAKDIIQAMKVHWAEHDFQSTNEELLHVMEEELDKLSVQRSEQTKT